MKRWLGSLVQSLLEKGPAARTLREVVEARVALEHRQTFAHVEQRLADARELNRQAYERQREDSDTRAQLAVREALAVIEHRLAETVEANRALVGDTERRLLGAAANGGGAVDREALEARAQLNYRQATAYVEQRFGEMGGQLRDMRQHIPAFLNAVATVPALAHELAAFKVKQLEVEGTLRTLDGDVARLPDLEARVVALSDMPTLLADLEAALRASATRLDALDNLAGRFDALDGVRERLDTLSDIDHRMASFPDIDARVSAFEKAESHLSAAAKDAMTRLEELDRQAVELRRLDGAATVSEVDRVNLWKSAERATLGIGELWQRVEFVRKEVLYELRFGPARMAASDAKTVMRIVDQERVDRARTSGACGSTWAAVMCR